MSWRNVVVGTLLSLIVLVSLQRFTPPQAAACLPGLENVTGVNLAGLGPFGPRADRAMNSRPLLWLQFGKAHGQISAPAASPADEPAAAATETAPAAEQATDAAPPAASAAKTAPSAAPKAISAAQPAVQPAAGAAPAPAADSRGSVAGFTNYTVAPGDDLASLAERFGTTREVIADASGIPVSQTLYPGMSLRVPTSDPAKVEPRQAAVAVSWSEVNDMWEVGTVAQVMDVRTGNIFYVMRRGGWAHADVEPVSAKDTVTILSDYGGEFSWARRPLVVTINGQRIAASQNFMPHGSKDIAGNDFPGHFCIHFLGSTTHGSIYTSNGVPTLDPAHQRCVQEAVGH